jgi:hypothetical protein
MPESSRTGRRAWSRRTRGDDGALPYRVVVPTARGDAGALPYRAAGPVACGDTRALPHQEAGLEPWDTW